MMFYRLQYKMDTDTFSLLVSVWSLCAFLSQLLLVPFLSLKLGMSDSIIILMAIISTSIANIIEALCNKIWVLFLSWSLLQILYSNVSLNITSGISKLVKSTEIGKICILYIANSLITLSGGPFYSFIYHATLTTIPALFIYITIPLYILEIVLTSYNYFGMKRNKIEAS